MWAALRLRALKRKAEDGQPTPNVPASVWPLQLLCDHDQIVSWQLQSKLLVEVSQPYVSDMDYRAACIACC